MINIWIFEDDIVFQNRLKQIIENYQIENDKSIFREINIVQNNYIEKINEISANKSHEINLYIIDVDLDEHYNGFDIAKAIREFDYNSNILFITSHIELMSKVFLLNLKVISYIYKLDPELEPRVFSAFEQIEKEHKSNIQNLDESENDFLKFYDNNTYYKILLKDIIAIETNQVKRKLKIITYEKAYECRDTLKNVIGKLPNNFVKSHRAIVLNTGLIKEIKINNSYHQALMTNGDIYNISRTYVKDILNEFAINSKIKNNI